MDRWDKLKSWGEKMSDKGKVWAGVLNEKKNHLGFLMDKHRVIRKLFILGIAINVYFIYEGARQYYQLKELNEHVSRARSLPEDRINVMKLRLLDQLKKEQQQ